MPCVCRRLRPEQQQRADHRRNSLIIALERQRSCPEIIFAAAWNAPSLRSVQTTEARATLSSSRLQQRSSPVARRVAIAPTWWCKRLRDSDDNSRYLNSGVSKPVVLDFCFNLSPCLRVGGEAKGELRVSFKAVGHELGGADRTQLACRRADRRMSAEQQATGTPIQRASVAVDWRRVVRQRIEEEVRQPVTREQTDARLPPGRRSGGHHPLRGPGLPAADWLRAIRRYLRASKYMFTLDPSKQPHPNVENGWRDLVVVIEAAENETRFGKPGFGSDRGIGQRSLFSVVDLIAVRQVNNLLDKVRLSIEGQHGGVGHHVVVVARAQRSRDNRGS